MLKSLCGGEPLLGLDCEALLDEFLNKCTIFFIKSLPVSLHEGNRAIAVGELPDLCWLIRSTEFVEKNTEGPHVNFWSDKLVILLYFWRHVAE